MSNLSLQAALSFYLIPGFGSAKTLEVLKHLSAEAFFQLSPSALENMGLKPPQISAVVAPDLARVESLLEWHQVDGQQIISLFDPAYPPQLRQIASAPLILFVKGDPQVLQSQQLAIVGSRQFSPAGRDIAADISQGLVAGGLTITSGLAIGIDAAAHRGALSAGGLTVAVLGTGVDCIYPRRHRALADEIIESGCLVSEFLPLTEPKAEHFPRRNRIVSGLSVGTLVVEAAIKSGSLITAKYALEQNREVFAVPGTIHNPLSKGCHHLIKQGATLVESAEDILQELSLFQQFDLKFEYTAPTVHAIKDKGAVETKPTCAEKVNVDYLATEPLLDTVGYEVTAIDTIVQRSGFTVDVVLPMLLDLEMQGVITAVPGGYIKLRRS